jgi:hypothetical protein
MLKSILEEQLGELTEEEFVFAMEQELLNCCQIDTDVLNKLATNIDFYRRHGRGDLN